MYCLCLLSQPRTTLMGSPTPVKFNMEAKRKVWKMIFLLDMAMIGLGGVNFLLSNDLGSTNT